MDLLTGPHLLYRADLHPVLSFTYMKILVTLCKLYLEGFQVGAHIFEKNIFMLQILFATADGMAPLVAPCHLLPQKVFAIVLILLLKTTETRSW